MHLENFSGPFELLLGLISKHRLDITEVALATVTDEFIAHIRAREGAWDLDEATGFLLVAATLLDLKAARLLPAGEVEDDEDLALLEARDLLFARLLQYRAFKEVAASFEARLDAEARRTPRPGGIDPGLGQLLPELVLGIGPEQLALVAAPALAPKPEPPGVHLAHLHAPRVSVREQAALLVGRLRRQRTSTFRGLVADADGTTTVVARFLALLELFREGVVAFEQVSPLAELTIRWTGEDTGDVDVPDEFDGAGEDDGDAPAPEPSAAGGDEQAGRL
ncbi:MAG: segregation and condensation protein A [Actinomycetes bacterium]